MFPQFPNPASPFDLLHHKIPSIWIVGCHRLVLEHATIESLAGYHSASTIGIPRVRRRNVVVAPLLPPSTVILSDGAAEQIVDL